MGKKRKKVTFLYRDPDGYIEGLADAHLPDAEVASLERLGLGEEIRIEVDLDTFEMRILPSQD